MAGQTLPIWEYNLNCISHILFEVGSYLYYTIIRKAKQIFPLSAEKFTRKFGQFACPAPNLFWCGERRAPKAQGAKKREFLKDSSLASYIG